MTSSAPPAGFQNPYRVPERRLGYEWIYLDDIRPFVKAPMLIKGVLTAEDARLSVGIRGERPGLSRDAGPAAARGSRDPD